MLALLSSAATFVFGRAKSVRYCIASAALVPLLSAAPASAWDGAINGKITRIDMTQGSNFDFRVFLDGNPACGAGSDGWVYMNTSYGNYQATAAALMTAWTTGKTITVYTNRSGGIHCEIGYVVFFQ